MRPRSKAIVVAGFLAALLAAGFAGAPFVHAASLENGGPRSIPDVQYGARSNQKLDLTLPSARFFGPRPVIVWLHAGGWEYGSRKDPAPLPKYEVGRGYAMASVEYGLSPTYHFPTPVSDVKLAIRFLKANARRYGLDPSRVIVAGYSAGAGLAAFVAVTPGQYDPPVPAALARVDDSVIGTIDISGGYDFVKLTQSQNLWAREAASALVGCAPTPLPAPLRCRPGIASAATVRNHLRANAPPVYLVHAKDDPLFLAPLQEAPLVAAWTKVRGGHGVQVQLVVGGHGIDIKQLDLPRINAFLDGLMHARVAIQLH